jgi:hypothetical protein
MKRRNFLTSLGALALAGIAFPRRALAAYTKQNTRVDRVQLDTTFDAAGAAVSVKGTAFLQTKLLVNDADSTDQVPAPWKSVGFDLIGAPMATTSYTAAGKTVTGVQLAALIRQAMLDEATRQNIS